jgi:hypothetical protein
MAIDNTYQALATSTLGSATASVTFSSISGSYTDLVLVCQLQGAGNADPGLRFNGDTATNYSSTVLHGDGTTATSFRYTSTTSLKSHNTGASMNGMVTSFIVSIQNYSNTTTYKTAITRYGSAGGETDAAVGLWRSTAAINSVTVVTSSNSYDVGSTFTLYGIKAA